MGTNYDRGSSLSPHDIRSAPYSVEPNDPSGARASWHRGRGVRLRPYTRRGGGRSVASLVSTTAACALTCEDATVGGRSGEGQVGGQGARARAQGLAPCRGDRGPGCELLGLVV